MLFLFWGKFNTNFDFDSFREITKLKADAVNKLQKVYGERGRIKVCFKVLCTFAKKCCCI